MTCSGPFTVEQKSKSDSAEDKLSLGNEEMELHFSLQNGMLKVAINASTWSSSSSFRLRVGGKCTNAGRRIAVSVQPYRHHKAIISTAIKFIELLLTVLCFEKCTF